MRFYALIIVCLKVESIKPKKPVDIIAAIEYIQHTILIDLINNKPERQTHKRKLKMQEIPDKMHIEQQQSDKKRSTFTSILKWTFIVLNGPGLLFIMLMIAKLLPANSHPYSTSNDFFILVGIISFLLNACLSPVAMLAAYKEHPVWLKKTGWYFCGIYAVGVLITSIGYIGYYRKPSGQECLRFSDCELIITGLDLEVYYFSLSILLICLIYFWMARKLATNLLTERFNISQCDA